MTHLGKLLASRAWWTLRPDTGGHLLTSGAQSGATRAVAARADDGAFGLVYLPTARSVTIDLGAMAGPQVDARWLDPSNGASIAASRHPFLASGSRLPASGSRELTPPSTNAAGDGDWVLLLESAG
jgi:hypothetical protein